jgi:hypothetical protein
VDDARGNGLAASKELQIDVRETGGQRIHSRGGVRKWL